MSLCTCRGGQNPAGAVPPWRVYRSYPGAGMSRHRLRTRRDNSNFAPTTSLRSELAPGSGRTSNAGKTFALVCPGLSERTNRSPFHLLNLATLPTSYRYEDLLCGLFDLERIVHPRSEQAKVSGCKLSEVPCFSRSWYYTQIVTCAGKNSQLRCLAV
jgi:hypothetical protein